MEFIAVLGAVAWATISLAWGFLWMILLAIFWLAVIIMVGFFSTIVVRAELLASRRGITAPETSASTIEAIRGALRSGALDGEIARINARNGARKSV